MELANPPSAAARAPAAWYGWWLLPTGLGAGSAATLAAGSDPARIPTAVAGLAATAAAAACVRILLRTRQELRRAADDARAGQSHQAQQWQQHVATLERRHENDRAAYEAHQIDEAKVWQWRLDRQQAVVARLADEFLPQAFDGLRGGEAIDDILPLALDQETEISPEFRLELRKVLRTALIAVEEEINRSTSAEQAVISIGSRIHVLTGKIRGRLHEMQGEHGGTPAVAQGLMELDQAIGPADCLAASIGVLGGTDRPGRQWQEPQRLLSVVRGGIGRIKDFDRVELRQLPELGVDGGLVDHLTLIFAHLLDNAARYSPHTEQVVVSGKEVPNGVGIEIQDAGKGLTDEKKQQALRALDGSADGSGIGGLSEDAHLGLRVVGTLARKHGIRIAFADSPWLGTSVVVVVPHTYFSQLPPAPVTAPARVQRAQVQRQVPAASAAQRAQEAEDVTPGGLPRRRRRADAPRRAGAGPETAPGATGAPAPPAAPPDASFTGMAAFATAGREPEDPHPEEPRTETPPTKESD